MIYITGSHGYIGSRLKSRGLLFDESIEECDLKIGRDVLTYMPKGKPDIIYHMAGQAGAVPSDEDPINDARQNILGTLKAIEIANKYEARLIFPASAASLEPKSPYGLSKKIAEEYIKMLCNDYVILRLSSIFGDKPVGVVDNFIRGSKCVIYGKGTAIRDFVHVDDIVEAFILAKNWPKGVYDCGSKKGLHILDLAVATGKEVVFEPARNGEIQRSVLENTTPDWVHKIDVIQYIKEKCRT